MLHGRPPRLELKLQAVDQLHGLGERVGDRSAGGRQIAPRPETSGVEHNLDPGLLCGAGVVRQVADQYGRSRVNLQPSEVVCQVFLLRVRWCRALDEREVRRQPAPLDAADGAAFLQGALGELYALLAAQQLTPSGPAGGIYADEVFTDHHGQSTIFLPCAGEVRPVGRVRPAIIPAAELAIMTHHGPAADVDRTYGALAAHVTRHALGVPGPIREYYLVGQGDTLDPSRWRTEIGWPVFLTGTGLSADQAAG